MNKFKGGRRGIQVVDQSEPLTDESYPVLWVRIHASPDNTGFIYVSHTEGDFATEGSEQGEPLRPGRTPFVLENVDLQQIRIAGKNVDDYVLWSAMVSETS